MSAGGGGERRLAAILSIDAVGYSRLMAQDEAATVRSITECREEIARLVGQHRGRVVDAPGDNVLAEFPAATAAVQCALEIQRALGPRNAELPPEQRMEFRIGVHLGEVLARGARIYGDGVNIAARLEGLAEPGGICVSQAVHEQTRGRLAVGFDDLGEQQVKNIPSPVRAYRVRESEARTKRPAARARRRFASAARWLVAAAVAIAAGVWLSWPAPLGLVLDLAGLGSLPVNPPLPDKPSIVVLPFLDLGDDAEQGYLAEGLTEDVTADLGAFEWVFVISRSTASTYAGTAVNATEVSRQLGVRYVVEGSVRRAGDRVRVTVQLIDAARDVHVWSERYDREVEDVLDLQAEISEQILGALGVEILEAESVRLRRRPTGSLSAYEALARGIAENRKLTHESLAAARAAFGRAIDADPEFAAAHAGLALSLMTERLIRCSPDRAQDRRARELAERAVALDSFEALSHVALSFVANVEGRGPEALAAAERAVELAPNFDVAQMSLGTALLLNGRGLEALPAFRQALRLSPRPPVAFMGMLGTASYAAGRREQGVEFWERARAANPDVAPVRILLAGHFEAEGQHEKAREVAQEILRADPGCTVGSAIDGLPFPSPIPELATRLRQAGLPDESSDAPDRDRPAARGRL